MRLLACDARRCGVPYIAKLTDENGVRAPPIAAAFVYDSDDTCTYAHAAAFLSIVACPRIFPVVTNFILDAKQGSKYVDLRYCAGGSAGPRVGWFHEVQEVPSVASLWSTRVPGMSATRWVTAPTPWRTRLVRRSVMLCRRRRRRFSLSALANGFRLVLAGAYPEN